MPAPSTADLLRSGKPAGRIGDAGLVSLLASGALSGVTSLSLRDAALGPDGARALASSPSLSALQNLDLEGNEIGDAGAAALAASTVLPSLRTLKLGHQGFGIRGHAARNNIGTVGATAFATSAHLALEQLDLPLYEIDSALAAALVTSPLRRWLYLFPGSVESARASPDGKHQARVTETAEVWPDGPRAGMLELGATRIAHVSPSLVWSADSASLAVVQWESGPAGYTGKSQLLLLSLEGKTLAELPPSESAWVLYALEKRQLSAFDAGAEERSDQLFAF